MFAGEIDPDIEPEDFTEYPDEREDAISEWETDPSDWDEAEYLEDGQPFFSLNPSDDYLPDDYSTNDYLTADYSSADFSLAGLPKFLFICTVVACLILAGVLSLVTVQVSITGSPVATAPGAAQAQTGAGSQPQADSALPSSPDNSNCSVSQRFPASIRRWCGLITQYASKHGLPPDLVAALIWQESGGNPVAYSQSGAVGLMQVMPSDGLAASFQCAAGPCFSTRPSTDELKNPEFNVSYGTRMLAGLVGRTGNLREALKSYGPANVGYYYADKVLGIYQSYSN